MSEILVEPASEAEAPACLALLPKLANARAELFIARLDGAFAGAAGVVWANAIEPVGFPILVRVLSRARRRGVGRALVAAATRLCFRETDGLWSLGGISSEDPAAKFLRACDFVAQKREFHFEVGVNSLFADVGPLAERFRARGGIPANAELVHLREPGAPLEEIAWLVSRAFDSSLFGNLADLARRRADDADRSLFARIDGEVVGALLWKIRAGKAIVDVRVVDARRRNSWPNIAMLDFALREGVGEGVGDIRFFCDETIVDTMSLSKRGDGQETDVKHHYRLAFA